MKKNQQCDRCKTTCVMQGDKFYFLFIKMKTLHRWVILRVYTSFNFSFINTLFSSLGLNIDALSFEISLIIPSWVKHITTVFGSDLATFSSPHFIYAYIYIYMCACVCMLSCFSHVQLFVTLWTVARQGLLTLRFSTEEY